MGSSIIALTFETIDDFDTAIGVGSLGVAVGLAAFKVAKHSSDLADNLLNFSRKILDKFSDIGSRVDTGVSLATRLERNASRWLDAFEQNPQVASNNVHFYSRHGAQTTNRQQHIRATIGLTPDGIWRDPGDSARFLTHRDQLNALHSALEIYNRTKQRVRTFDMGYIVLDLPLDDRSLVRRLCCRETCVEVEHPAEKIAC